MRRNGKLVVLIGIVLLFVVLYGVSAQTTQNGASTQTSQIQTWEYMIKEFRALYSAYESDLNEYGAKGWQLVSVVKSSDTTYVLIFIRPKQ